MSRDKIDWPALRAQARAAMARAYAPYSGFPVGAAGQVASCPEAGPVAPAAPAATRIVSGCNVENASSGLSLCAECGVVSALHASGGGRLVALACVDAAGTALMPCGRCRQLLWEHGGADCLVDTVDGPVLLAQLLPAAFDASDLARAKIQAGPAQSGPASGPQSGCDRAHYDLG